jgi:hypothetical protein
MIRLMSNIDMAPCVMPEPVAVNLVKPGQLNRAARSDEYLPIAACESVVNLPRRSPQTSNTERKLKDLEYAVVNGLISPAEADRVFGQKPIGSGGRSRKRGQEDFATWLRTRIDLLSDRDALIEEIASLQADRTMPRARRAARVRKLNSRVNASDPAYVGRLRQALAMLNDAQAIDVETVLRRQAERATALREKLQAIRAA